MTNSYLQKVESLTKLGAKEYIDQLFEEVYPSLYEMLGSLITEIKRCEDLNETAAVTSIVQNMTSELDEMTNKEKIVLFPYILKMVEENKRSSNGKPVESIKQHFKNLLTGVNDLTYFNQQIEEEHKDSCARIQHCLNDFEETLTALQDHKERFLYRKYLSLF